MQRRVLSQLLAWAAIASAGCISGGSAWRATAEAEARRAIANEATLDPRTYPVRTLAVLPLAPPDDDTLAAPIGFALAELISADLQRTGRVVIVDRIRIDALLRELALTQSGRVDTSRAPRVGRLVGARRITSGVMVAADTSYLIQMRVADVLTGELVAVAPVSLTPDNYAEAMQEMVLRLLDALGLQLTAQEREDMQRRAASLPPLDALIAFGRGAMASAAGDTRTAQRYYAEAVKGDSKFRLAGERLDDLREDPTSLGDDARLKQVTESVGNQVNPPAPVRTAEAADAPGASVRRLVTLIIQLGFP